MTTDGSIIDGISSALTSTSTPLLCCAVRFRSGLVRFWFGLAVAAAKVTPHYSQVVSLRPKRRRLNTALIPGVFPTKVALLSRTQINDTYAPGGWIARADFFLSKATAVPPTKTWGLFLRRHRRGLFRRPRDASLVVCALPLLWREKNELFCVFIRSEAACCLFPCQFGTSGPTFRQKMVPPLSWSSKHYKGR